jgi:hypothetical protein
MRLRALHVAMWVLSRFATDVERESIVGDLTEEYSLRANAASSATALKWVLQQVCASATPLLWTRLTRAAWMATFGVAVLAYIAVGVVELLVNWAISSAGTSTYNLLGLLVMFPLVVLIGYFAARFRRRSAALLGTMMLLVVTAMTLWSSESVPLGYRIAFFLVGPAAAFTGGALRSLRPTGP